MEIQKNIFIAFTIFFVAIGLFLSINNSWVGYSYWWDELYSVAAASESYPDMFKMLILPDVHPPLYQLTLNFWVTLFGTSEIATRALSLFFTISSLLLATCWSFKRLNLLSASAAIVFFSTNWLFAYYAQESRSYAMVLFLSTLLTTLFLDSLTLGMTTKRLLSIVTLAAMLSLTHYFGLIYSGIIITFTMFHLRHDPAKAGITFLAGLICLIWPVIHFFFGGISGKTGGNFWIKSNGIESTLTIASQAITPQLGILGKVVPASSSEFIVALAFLFICGVVIYFSLKEILQNKNNLADYAYISTYLLLALFFLTVIFIDQKSPISTPRNFIVILPAFSIIFGLAFAGACANNYKLALYLIFSCAAANLFFEFRSVSQKQHPTENHKEAVRFIVDDSRPKINKPEVYFLLREDASEFHDLQEKIARFYFEKSGATLKIKPISSEAIGSLTAPYYIFIQHSPLIVKDIIETLTRENIKYNIYSPEQTDKNGVIVLYSQN